MVKKIALLKTFLKSSVIMATRATQLLWEALTRKAVEKVTVFDPGLNPECCWLHFFPFKFFCFKAYEKQKQTRKSTTQLESKSGEREKVEKFKTTENSIVSKPINPFMFGNYQ